MDSTGRIYNPDDPRPRPADAIDVPHESVIRLRDMNRRARKAYYSERRRGATEQEALDAASLSYRS